MQDPYSEHYSEESLFDKLKKYAKVAGSKVVYSVLLLYYLMIDKETPLRTRITIAAALGYFIFPLDAIPDLTPILGYSDDLGVLIFALSQYASSITENIKEKAKAQLSKWFSKIKVDEINEVETKINKS